MVIRAEEQGDWAAVQEVNASPFETSAEARLVGRLREEARPVISLVAEHEDEIVGHIIFSPVSLSGHTDLKMMGLGPMAVLPKQQRKGLAQRWSAPGLEESKEL